MNKYSIFALAVFLLPFTSQACSYMTPEEDENRFDAVLVGELIDYQVATATVEGSNPFADSFSVATTETFMLNVKKAYSGDYPAGKPLTLEKYSSGAGTSCDIYPVFSEERPYDKNERYVFVANIYDGKLVMESDGPEATTLWLQGSGAGKLEQTVAELDERYADVFTFEPGLPEITILTLPEPEPETETEPETWAPPTEPTPEEVSFLWKQIEEILKILEQLRELMAARS